MEGTIDLNAILGQIGKDKGIDKQVLIEAIESAAPEDPPEPIGEGELLGWLARRGEGDA